MDLYLYSAFLVFRPLKTLSTQCLRDIHFAVLAALVIIFLGDCDMVEEPFHFTINIYLTMRS